MLAIVGASGKLGSATLHSLLRENLLPASEIICTTSSSPDSSKWMTLSSTGVQVRPATFESPDTFTTALSGASELLLISSPRIDLDFFTAPPNSGRENDHAAVLTAAVQAGVKHVYYTSLAFASTPPTGDNPKGIGNSSKADVMRAHLRTEAMVKEMHAEHGIAYTIVREGLYSESWPLYLGYFDPAGRDARNEVLLAGDGRANWTAIADLGLANALLLTAPSEDYAGKTLYLANAGETNLMTVGEVAGFAGKYRKREVKVRIVGKEEHVRCYVGERRMPRDAVEWWVSTYEALEEDECLVQDDTLERILRERGREVKGMEETVREMVRGE